MQRAPISVDRRPCYFCRVRGLAGGCRFEAIFPVAIEVTMSKTKESLLDPRVEGQHVIRTDPHCHILPGLDDGAPDLAMSLRMARRMVSLGIMNVIATPHGIHPGIDTNVDPDYLRDQVAQLNHVFLEEGIPLLVYPGTEVFLRRRVISQFKKGNIMTWADQGKFVLVELGFQQRSESALEVVDYFLENNITPIIAHPERYLWLPRDPELFVGLRSRGCIFQFNTMSINGHFGPRARHLALRLLPHSGHFIIGTDSHHDADRYFDFAAVKAELSELGLIDDSGLVRPGESTEVPDLSDLASTY